ncbi:MAG: hypothetical protein ACR2J9_08785, partial [Gaiellales bacterium]
EIANYAKAAKRAHGAERKRLLATAAAKRVALAAGKGKCSPAAAGATSSSATASSLPPGSYPARFAVQNSVAILRYDGTTRKRHRGTRQAAGQSNMDVMQPSGALRNAVSAGLVSAAAVVVGPDGDLYMVSNGVARFEQPDGSVIDGCAVFRVRRSDGWVTCISPPQEWTWVSPDVGKPLQVAADGSVYYLVSSSSIVLKRWRNGVVTTLTNTNINVNGYAALANGDVVITGSTMSGGTPSGAQWTRVLHPNNSLQTLVNSRALYLSVFPDGNLYYGTGGAAYTYDAGSGTNSGWSGLAILRGEATTTDGKVFARTDNSLYRQYPMSGQVLTPSFTTLTAISAAGTRVALAGNGMLSGGMRLGLYDPGTGTTTLVDNGMPEMEYYSLAYAPSKNAVVFDALRFQDNTYVIGQIDLASDTVSILSTTATKLSDVTGY